MTEQVFSGSAKRFKGTFKKLGVKTDPTTVSLDVRDPDGTVTSYSYANGTLTKEATGIYFRDVPLTKEGVWKGRMAGTGAVTAVDVVAVEVKADPFA